MIQSYRRFFTRAGKSTGSGYSVTYSLGSGLVSFYEGFFEAGGLSIGLGDSRVNVLFCVFRGTFDFFVTGYVFRSVAYVIEYLFVDCFCGLRFTMSTWSLTMFYGYVSRVFFFCLSCNCWYGLRFSILSRWVLVVRTYRLLF